MDYPIWDLAMGGGMLMAIVAIPHVIVSHFAIGGGLLIVVTESLAVKRNDPELRALARRSSFRSEPSTWSLRPHSSTSRSCPSGVTSYSSRCSWLLDSPPLAICCGVF